MWNKWRTPDLEVKRCLVGRLVEKLWSVFPFDRYSELDLVALLRDADQCGSDLTRDMSMSCSSPFGHVFVWANQAFIASPIVSYSAPKSLSIKYFGFVIL